MPNDKKSQISAITSLGEPRISDPESLRGLNGEQDLGLSRVVLQRIGRRRRRAWLAWGFVVFVVVALAGLYGYPQTYSATVSIAMQQPNQTSSALMALTGNTNKKYTGVLKSRYFAEQVDKSVHFRELLGLKPTARGQDEAIERVAKEVRVDDNAADGLLYVTVNLQGPPRLWPDPGGARRTELCTQVARAANLYSGTLKLYLKNTDVDKELALLRAADSQVAKAQKSYYDSIESLGSFVRHTRILAMPAGGSGSSGGSSDSAAGGSQVASLLSRRAELEERMQSTDTVLKATRGLLTNPDQKLTALPEEDPLLVNARRQVIDAEANLDNLEITFGSSMQSVRRARERLKLAQAQLHREVATILRGRTSDDVRRQALQAEYETVERQITDAESHFQSNRNLTFELEKRRNEVAIKLESLKAILTRYAELKIQTVSAQNRMVTVDDARPPTFGSPGIALILVVAVLAALLFVAVWWTAEYLIASQKALSQEQLVRE
jgi:uncharacterized protein involved in exopolysaccharide biosynthesis